MKTLERHDVTEITFPADYGREQLTDLDFREHAQDLILFVDVGTGKTHLATALAVAACRHGVPAKFYTTAGLVIQHHSGSPAGATLGAEESGDYLVESFTPHNGNNFLFIH